jgi:hypothetical protein
LNPHLILEAEVRVEIVHTGGRYVERVLAYLSAASPGDVTAYQVPRGLPPILDDGAEYLPAELGAAEVIIAINIHPELLLGIPDLVKGRNARGLIAPIEDPNWIKPGLERQVTQACVRSGIESAFPKPFCALEASSPVIAEFSRLYRVGAPLLRISQAEGKVVAVEVLRGSPCGLTDFVAKSLVGLPADESLPEKAGQLHHAYPCLASMSLDPATGDTIMHASLYLLRERVAQALRASGAAAEPQPKMR